MHFEAGLLSLHINSFNIAKIHFNNQTREQEEYPVQLNGHFRGEMDTIDITFQ